MKLLRIPQLLAAGLSVAQADCLTPDELYQRHCPDGTRCTEELEARALKRWSHKVKRHNEGIFDGYFVLQTDVGLRYYHQGGRPFTEGAHFMSYYPRSRIYVFEALGAHVTAYVLINERTGRYITLFNHIDVSPNCFRIAEDPSSSPVVDEFPNRIVQVTKAGFEEVLVSAVFSYETLKVSHWVSNNEVQRQVRLREGGPLVRIVYRKAGDRWQTLPKGLPKAHHE